MPKVAQETGIIIYKKMYCFGNNFDFGFDWQLAYNQLCSHYAQLTTDYQKAIELGQSLAARVSKIMKENDEIRKAKISNVFQTHPNAVLTSLATIPPAGREITMENPPRSARKIKTMNSIETSENNFFECTYQCGRVYKSTVSMNLHIKVKHNGGTKKEREEYAKAIFDAEERGEVPPEPPITFPPNFLKEFRITYEYMKKYAM